MGEFWVCRDLFCPSNACDLWVNITSPLEGSSHGRNIIPLVANVSSNVSVDCWFRIDTGGWNLFNCSSVTVTVPNNLNVNLTVLAVQGSCSALDSVSFTVYGRPGGYWVDGKSVGFFMVLSSLAFLWLVDNEMPKKRKRHI